MKSIKLFTLYDQTFYFRILMERSIRSRSIIAGINHVSETLREVNQKAEKTMFVLYLAEAFIKRIV